MGNICVSREEDPRETLKQYEDYHALWREVVAKIDDDARLTSECSRVYKDECARLCIPQLTKEMWQMKTANFVNRITCHDPRTNAQIYRAVDGLYIGPPDRVISEGTFIEFTRLALTLAERALCDKISKLKAKHGFSSAVQPFVDYNQQIVQQEVFQGGCSQPVDFKSTPCPPRCAAMDVPQVPAAQHPLKQLAQQLPQIEDSVYSQCSQPSNTQINQHICQGGFGDQLAAGVADDPYVTHLWSPGPDPDVPQLRPRRESDHKLQLPLSAQRLQDLQRQQAAQENQLREGLGSITKDKCAPQAHDDLRDARVVNGDSAGGPAVCGRTVPTSETCYPGQKTNPARDGILLPPTLNGPGRTAEVPREVITDTDLDTMRRNILCGNLRVFVFNKNFELQAKRLALNPNSRRISILRDDGLCEDSWEIDGLRCVTRGVDASVLAGVEAPPGAAAFRFRFHDSDDEDRFLCVVFESLRDRYIATETFGQLCEVPVEPA